MGAVLTQIFVPVKLDGKPFLKYWKLRSKLDYCFREGHDCSVCVPLGGCEFGGCTMPFECNCSLAKNETLKNKYTGSHCDIRKCFNLKYD